MCFATDSTTLTTCGDSPTPSSSYWAFPPGASPQSTCRGRHVPLTSDPWAQPQTKTITDRNTSYLCLFCFHRNTIVHNLLLKNTCMRLDLLIRRVELCLCVSVNVYCLTLLRQGTSCFIDCREKHHNKWIKTLFCVIKVCWKVQCLIKRGLILLWIHLTFFNMLHLSWKGQHESSLIRDQNMLLIAS